MAEPNPTNTGGADGTAAFKKDFFDDSTPQKLIDDNDFVSLYLRCRYDRRGDIETGQLHDFEAGLPQEFKEKLPNDYKDKIKRELDRIAELRAVFVGKSRNRPDVVKLNKLKAAWKKNAISSRHANLNSNMADIKVRMNKLIKERVELQEEFETFKNEPAKATQIGKDLETKDAEIQTARIRADDKDRILKEVAKWKSPDDLVDEEGKDVPDVVGYGFTVSKITLEKEKSDNAADTASFDKYQMKRYSVSEVLEPKDGHDPWARENTESIRYFHFPANNMEWIEKNITMKAKTTDRRHQQFYLGNCGQGSSVALQMIRLMLGTCAPTANLFLEMPYLHWEMDRNRAHLANVAKKLTFQYRAKQPRYDKRNKNILAYIVKDKQKKHGIWYQAEVEELTNSDQPFSRKVGNPCGRYLMQAAKVYEAMDLEPDVKLLHGFLHDQPSFHPRRTLDQYYHAKREDTQSLDRDQIVYRSTNEKWKIHSSSRIVMVDQLWMYILDENTVITSFPKRLGHNEPGSSDVHRCIRDRLKKIRPGQINSVYDLALLIINDCSMVFFDRINSTDERPEVLDIFETAIRHLSEKKDLAVEISLHQFGITGRRHIEMSPEIARFFYMMANSRLQESVSLSKDAHDILEELKIMTQIYTNQIGVTHLFSKGLQPVDEESKYKSMKIDLLLLILHELEKKNSSSSISNVIGISSIESAATKVNQVVLRRTFSKSQNLANTISNCHSTLHQLQGAAREVAEEIQELFTLNQQLASIIEATAELERAYENSLQGRSIMIFTFITIIFLPLSFMSSIFGMNAVEITGPSNSVMGIKEQFEYMFPISIALTLFSILWALKKARLRLTILPFFLFFPIVIIRAAWYGLKDKPKAWERLFLYLHVGSAKEKLGDKYREMVTVVYQRCHESKAKDTTNKPQPSANKDQEATADKWYEEFYLGDKAKDFAPAIEEDNV
ncbi:hypothetical protein BofuT4_P129290.1 [Botrytis cinerea T4]|uniref:Uncharacterized protein n=1 Tax=Botryotinia fuckeliana (strain T4) TaxID=999810 RepID=G2YRI1_BOTF4|nr:hypothetical protein BofuT4_P129290.1 [Botrytis cinerea T4]